MAASETIDSLEREQTSRGADEGGHAYGLYAGEGDGDGQHAIGQAEDGQHASAKTEDGEHDSGQAVGGQRDSGQSEDSRHAVGQAEDVQELGEKIEDGEHVSGQAEDGQRAQHLSGKVEGGQHVKAESDLPPSGQSQESYQVQTKADLLVTDYAVDGQQVSDKTNNNQHASGQPSNVQPASSQTEKTDGQLLPDEDVPAGAEGGSKALPEFSLQKESNTEVPYGTNWSQTYTSASFTM
jgi:hypothetical protein